MECRESAWLEWHISDKPSSTGRTASPGSPERNQYEEEEAQTRVSKRKASERQSEGRGASKGSLEEGGILLDGLGWATVTSTTSTSRQTLASPQHQDHHRRLLSHSRWFNVNWEWSDGSKTKSQPQFLLGSTAAETPLSAAAQLTWLCKKDPPPLQEHPAARGKFVRPRPAVSAGPGSSARSPPPS